MSATIPIMYGAGQLANAFGSLFTDQRKQQALDDYEGFIQAMLAKKNTSVGGISQSLSAGMAAAKPGIQAGANVASKRLGLDSGAAHKMIASNTSSIRSDLLADILRQAKLLDAQTRNAALVAQGQIAFGRG